MREIPYNGYIPLFLGLKMHFSQKKNLTVTFVRSSAEFMKIIKEGFSKGNKCEKHECTC